MVPSERLYIPRYILLNMQQIVRLIELGLAVLHKIDTYVICSVVVHSVNLLVAIIGLLLLYRRGALWLFKLRRSNRGMGYLVLPQTTVSPLQERARLAC